jgi:hypothetical protein
MDGELGFKGLFGEHTDLGVGFAGGGFADHLFRNSRRILFARRIVHRPFRRSVIERLHLLNPDWRVPAWWIGRMILHHEFTSGTAKLLMTSRFRMI